MYGFEGVGLSEVQLSISELSVVGGGAQTHFMVGPGRGPTKMILCILINSSFHFTQNFTAYRKKQ